MRILIFDYLFILRLDYIEYFGSFMFDYIFILGLQNMFMFGITKYVRNRFDYIRRKRYSKGTFYKICEK